MVDLERLRQETMSLDELTREAYVEEVRVVPMDDAAARVWRSTAAANSESWVFAAGGGKTSAVDRPSDLGTQNPIDAIVFSPLHSQLVGWWLFHVWRSVDLLKAGLDASESGTTSVAAVTSRALIEELGCLVTEVRQIRKAWEAAKLMEVDPVRRVEQVRDALNPILTNVLLASRMRTKPADAPSATNVLTYVSKLDKLSKSSKFSDWYDWLSDASHPAYGARLVYVTNPLRHASGAAVLRLHSRTPLHLVNSGGDRIDFTYDIEGRARAALGTCGSHLIEYLYAGLKLVDDFGLTTCAAAMTERTYWRNLVPPQLREECPCGCGEWVESVHVWGAHVPAVPVLSR